MSAMRDGFKRFTIVLLAVLTMFSIAAAAEDPNPVELKYPIKYSYEYKDDRLGIVKSAIEVEWQNTDKLKFKMMTVAHDNVCAVSGYAQSISKDSHEFRFIYKNCSLNLKMSNNS